MSRHLTMAALLLRAAAHNLIVGYTDRGYFSINYDYFRVVSAGFPAAISFRFPNGTQPDWNWMRTPLSQSFDIPTTTYSLQYEWGLYTVQHIRSSVSSLDIVVSLTPNSTGVGIANGDFGINGDLAYWAPNASNLFFPDAITGLGFPCSGCWPPNCGDYAACNPMYAQAIPIDFTVGAAAWVRLDAPPPAPAPPFTSPWLTVGVHSPDKLEAGSRYTLLASLAGAVAPGQTLSARFSLRFGDGSGPMPGSNASAPLALVRDVLADFGRARPFVAPVLKGGPVGALFGSNCGASCSCSSLAPAACPNPRGWNNEIADGAPINTTNPAGVAAFQAAARAWVNTSIDYCLRSLGPGPAACQGLEFWAIEGSEYSWDTYVGSPDLLPELAPEMDAIADELFAMVTGAGLRLGLTLRPQVLTPSPDWNASVPPTASPQRYYQRDLYLPDNSTDVAGYAANIVRKAQYAIKRWNASMFYVDSTVNSNGVLPFQVWDRVAAALPGAAFFPEETDVNDFAAVAPLQDNWGSAAIPVNPAVKLIWPAAYSLQLLQLPINATLTPVAAWVPIVQAGDVLRVDAWYNSSNNWFVKAVYEAAFPPAAALLTARP